MRYVIILLAVVCLMFGGCAPPAKVKVEYNPTTGLVSYERTGDIEVGGFSAILDDKTLVEFDSSKSENLAYREGIMAAKEIISQALDKAMLGVGK